VGHGVGAGTFAGKIYSWKLIEKNETVERDEGAENVTNFFFAVFRWKNVLQTMSDKPSLNEEFLHPSPSPGGRWLPLDKPAPTALPFPSP
jgi:hypothetical protein